MDDHQRVCVPELDAVIGHRFNVLNDGFVRLVDYMGSDESIVQAARVSYGRGTKKVHEDRGLIRYLMRHRHTTPFEMCEIKLHVRVPMDCWRQWIRHRTANVNEYSTRYSEAIDSAQKTSAEEWREQVQGNRQGSGEFIPLEAGTQLSQRESELHALARTVYEERLASGVAREQARKDLPLATYTEAYWKIDLHNLLHFLSLRMDAHAQVEIRSYANVIGTEIVRRWCPITWEAFVDYRLESSVFSRIEMSVIVPLVSNDSIAAMNAAQLAGLLESDNKGLKRSREREELETKLVLLGLIAPWKQSPQKEPE
jgi:thymidylate synthase (FAD)